MATSMAATLAASLPAPQATPQPTAPVHDAIPASMSKLIDVEGEIAVQTVQLDGLVVSKIIHHSSSSHHSNIHGLLLGLDLDGILEVSNSFPLPHNAGDEDDKATKSTSRYQSSMLRSLKEVRSDDSVIGFYQATTLGAFFNQSLIDVQAAHQDRLRHGGIIIILDTSQSRRSSASLRAFRLSKQFMNAHRRSGFTSQSLINTQLKFSSVLEEIPVRIRTNPVLNAFLDNLLQPASTLIPDPHPDRAFLTSLSPSYSHLDVGNTTLSKNLEHLVEALDAYKTEESNVAYHQRQIAREKAKAEAYLAKRKEENASRIAQGLAPFPEEDIRRLFKISAEPSRLESVLLLGRIDAYAKALEGLSSSSLAKIYSAKASAGLEI